LEELENPRLQIQRNLVEKESEMPREKKNAK